MITIYDHSGNIRYTTPINKGCKRKFMMMTEDYITVKFSNSSVIGFDLGDYIEIDNLPNGAKRFELTSLYSPKYNQNTGGYDYEIRFDAYYWKWKNRKIKYRPEYGANESSFSLTSTPDVHLNVLVSNLKSIGWTYYDTGTAFSYKIDTKIASKNIALTYSNISILDALTEIAKACEAEWWIEGSVIHLGEMKVETNDVQTLSLSNGTLQSLERRENSNTYATRIYPFGSTRNLSNRYRKTLSFVKNAASTNTLDDPFGNGSKGYYLFSDVTKPLRLSYFNASYIKNPEYELVETVWSDYGQAYSSAIINCTGGFYVLDLSGLSIEHSKGTVSVSVNDMTAWTTETDEANTVVISDELPVMVKSDKYTKILVQINTPSSDTHKVSGNIKLKRQKYALTKVSYSGYEFDAYVYPNTNTQVANKVDNLNCVLWVRDTLHTLPADGVSFDVSGLIEGKVPESYFTSENDQELSLGIYQQNLLLPKEIGSYIDVQSGLNDSQIVEEIVVWDDIFPSAGGTVESSRIETETNDEGKEVPVYLFHSSNVVNFDTESYILQGQELHIVFSSGKLNGLDFEAAVEESDSTGTTFKLFTNENYGGITIPNSTQFPSEGDTFSFYGIDASILNGAAIETAEQELYQRALSYIAKINKDTANYDGKLMANYAYEHSFQAGETVNVVSSQFFKNGIRESRILGFEYPLDIPYDNPIYTIGEGTTYSRLGEIESKLNDLKFAGKTYTPVSGGVGGSRIYIIKSDDATEPTDNNVFSAKRIQQDYFKKEESKKQFLAKISDDTAQGRITFEKGIALPTEIRYRYEDIALGGSYELDMAVYSSDDGEHQLGELVEYAGVITSPMFELGEAVKVDIGLLNPVDETAKYGIVFYDAEGMAIQGAYLNGAETDGYAQKIIDVPGGATQIRFTIWTDNYDGHYLKYGYADEVSVQAIDKIVTSEEVSQSELFTDKALMTAATFAKLFKVKTDPKTGKEYILTTYPFASEGSVSTKGVGKSEDGEQVSYDRLDEWPVEWDESLNGYVLSAKLGQNLRERIETLEETKDEEDGIAGEDDKNFVYTQGSPSDTWVIEHNLNKYPSVTVIDSAYSVVLGDVRYDSLNQVTLMFAGEFSGQATLN